MHCNDVNEFTSKIVYENVIKQLNNLVTEGIQININGENINVFFKLALITGDNLGFNSMLGFIKSFNADYFCRFCKVKKKNSTMMTKEENSTLRNREKYNLDVKENNCQQTGIAEECIWNNVLDFHVTENFCVDIMHDLLEGVCNYNMGLILSKLITDTKSKLESFNFK